MKFFHGGVPKLKVGDMILPPEQTGAPTTADYGAEGVCRRDRVYLTTDVAAAAIYAAMHPSCKGCVYEVVPIGEVLADPDCNEAGLSFSAKRAKVVRVIKLKFKKAERIRSWMIADHDRQMRTM